MTDKSKLLEKVRALIAKADSTDFPAEADAFRAKADALMLAHSISEFELKDPSQNQREVVSRDFDMIWYQYNPWCSELYSIFYYVAQHCRVKIITWKYTGATIPVVGTEADLDFCDMLFTGIMMEQSKGLEPKPRENEQMIDYLVRAKEAGMKWERIGQLMVEHGIADFDEYQRNVGVRFTKLYTDYCNDHGRLRLRTSPQVYQRSFAMGFTAEIVDRLHKIRTATLAEYKESHDSNTTDLVLADIKSLVDARAKQLFGHPPTVKYEGARRSVTPQRKIDHTAIEAGRRSAREVNLGNRKVTTDIKRLER